LLDGVLFEKSGVPSAAIITDQFVGTANAMAATWGVPNYSFLVLPHPIANLTEQELDQRAREIAPEVARFLLEGQP